MPKQSRFTRRQPKASKPLTIRKSTSSLSLSHKLSSLALKPTISILNLRNRTIIRRHSGPNLGQHLDRPNIIIEPFEFPLTGKQLHIRADDTDTETDTTDSAHDSDLSMSSMSSNDSDDGFAKNPEYGVCCFCAQPCNICSQACGRCMRTGTFFSS